MNATRCCAANTSRALVRDPTEGPVSLALNAKNCFDGVERCNTSLTKETTNTKHTHKRSKAQ